MDKKTIFEKVWQRAKDKRKAVRSGTCVCLYRDKVKNISCFVGVLIPDEMYDLNMDSTNDNNGLKMIFSRFPPVARLLDGDNNINFLTSLQTIHDHYEPASWEGELKNIYKGEFGTEFVEPVSTCSL